MKNRFLSNLLRLSIALGCVSATLAQSAGEAGRIEVAEGRISIHVVDGSVVELATELGRLRGFEVIAEGVRNARVSLNLDGLTTTEAIRAICKPIGYVAVPDPATGETTRLLLMPAKATAKNRLEPRRDPLAPRTEVPLELPPEPNVPDQEQADHKPSKRDD
jgi:hypothetical protein